jgi:hypothetical protein
MKDVESKRCKTYVAQLRTHGHVDPILILPTPYFLKFG